MKNLLTFVVAAVALLASSYAVAQQKAAPKRPTPEFEKITDDPKLPRVLLIGDSISIGYTLPVRELLLGKANVHRIGENGGPTINGTAKIDTWLANGKWDVIHFNWGLHDIKTDTGKHQVGIEDYERNLRELVKKMKATGAKLIWCSTTPVPAGELKPPRSDADVVAFNAVAKKVMIENGVEIDDLYAYALPKLAEIQRPVNVHFTPDGSKVLAKQVASSIEVALPKK